MNGWKKVNEKGGNRRRWKKVREVNGREKTLWLRRACCASVTPRRLCGRHSGVIEWVGGGASCYAHVTAAATVTGWKITLASILL